MCISGFLKYFQWITLELSWNLKEKYLFFIVTFTFGCCYPCELIINFSWFSCILKESLRQQITKWGAFFCSAIQSIFDTTSLALNTLILSIASVLYLWRHHINTVHPGRLIAYFPSRTKAQKPNQRTKIWMRRLMWDKMNLQWCIITKLSINNVCTISFWADCHI